MLVSIHALEQDRHAVDLQAKGEAGPGLRGKGVLGDAGLAQASKNLGDLLYRDGRYDDAASAYERTVRADPELGDDVYARLGNVYYRRRDRKRAIDMWTRALKLNPSNEVVRTNLEFVRGPASDG